ncbi:MAG: sulfite exporter TauE/SafE family protein [Elusimicrobia bacterium]|nr:sulfite exporter TauE/SafE family protein [Elusimicrobiota bacterium]
MNALLYIALGVAVGAFSGLVGVGGGILVVPALIYGFGFSQLLAQGTSTALLLPPIGVFAAYTYWKNGYVDVRAAALICAGFAVGGYFGAKLVVALPKDAVRRLFGGFLLLVSLKMLSGR